MIRAFPEHSHKKNIYEFTLCLGTKIYILFHFKPSCIYQGSPPNVTEVMTFGTIRVLVAASLQPSFAFSLSLSLSLCHGATAPNGLGPPHYRGFTISLRHTTLGRTSLDE